MEGKGNETVFKKMFYTLFIVLDVQLTVEQHGLNCMNPLMCRFFFSINMLEKFLEICKI